MKRVVAIGNFDGVHLGHQHVLRRAQAIAQERDAQPTVLTFDPHPVRFFKPETPEFLLVPTDRKASVLRDFGVEVVFRKFDAAFSKLSPLEFVRDILHRELEACVVLVGEGFRYGSGRKGDEATLRRDCAEFGISVEVMSPTLWEGEIISSSRIRKMLMAGDLDGVRTLLGRPHTTYGRVVHGDGIGHTLGFPTANVDVSNCILPAEGIYATYLHEGERRWPAATYVGTRPTFDGQDLRIEAYVLDEDNLELYGEDVGVEWIGRVRGDQGFDSADALIAQMEIDVENVRRLLEVTP